MGLISEGNQGQGTSLRARPGSGSSGKSQTLGPLSPVQNSTVLHSAGVTGCPEQPGHPVSLSYHLSEWQHPPTHAWQGAQSWATVILILGLALRMAFRATTPWTWGDTARPGPHPTPVGVSLLNKSPPLPASGDGRLACGCAPTQLTPQQFEDQ